MTKIPSYRIAFTATLIALITVAGGAIHGRLGLRWGSPEAMSALAGRLEAMPGDLGDWQLQQSFDLSPTVAEMLRCKGYINRLYVHRENGATVRVAVILGPTAPTAVHTPEVCFSSRSASVHQPRRRVGIGSAGENATDEFWHLVFRPRDGASDDVHVFYAWSTGETWEAPDSQRLAFLGYPWLLKLQLATHSGNDLQSDGKSTGKSFLSEFVPALRRTLNGPP